MWSLKAGWLKASSSECERLFRKAASRSPSNTAIPPLAWLCVDLPIYLGRCSLCIRIRQTSLCPDLIVPPPDKVPARRAILAANMETALNALWDSGPGPGDRIVIVGAGAVGLLVTNLAARLPGAEVLACDIDPAREDIARALGASFSLPDGLGKAEADVVFHASATASGLATALLSAGFRKPALSN